MKKIICRLLFLLLTLNVMELMAADMKIDVFSTADGKSLGYVQAVDTHHGILLTPHVFGLSPGLHGMHIHENPSCENHAADAGGHWDPHLTHAHLGPYADGHLGDLPAVYVDAKGNATLPVLAPNLTLKELAGHSLMIHAGADNYSDNPSMGGGGERFACGVIS
jgi:superoxide dismutase, Cu-Zn family